MLKTSKKDKKKNKGLGFKTEQNSNGNHKRKVNFSINLNSEKKFDNRKTVLLESNKSKKLKILPKPTKGCLKKVV